MKALNNAKHEHFAQLVSNGETHARAYVLAGYNEKGARQNAARLIAKDDVRDRIDALRRQKESAHAQATQAVFAEAALDKAWVLKRLARIVDMGMAAEPVRDADGNPSGEYRANLNAANKALELIGKEAGMFIDRKEIRTGDLDGLEHDELKQIRDALTAAGGLAATAGSVAESSQRTTH
jgi:phage terminase small subunit